MSIRVIENEMVVGRNTFQVSRPHRFGLVIAGPPEGLSGDYLHEILLAPEHREMFFRLIEREGLVVCKNVQTSEPTYRRVRGKSSHGKLSQAEYYHHDGCSCPVKPRIVEIRLPHQEIERNVATAVARFPDVMRAMLQALPDRLTVNPEIADDLQAFGSDESRFPAVEQWDKIQGRVTRLVRRDMDAESSRAYFRDVDEIAGSYVAAWEMGESRLMLNSTGDLTRTMQHRRAYQKPREPSEKNGSLLKRWTAEEV